MKKLFIKESYGSEGQYEYIKSKEVYDYDGWRTEYTMYYDLINDRYVFVFGDSDLYNPNDGYEEFDWECDSEAEANEWFDNYSGYDDLDESMSYNDKEYPKIQKGMYWAQDEFNYTVVDVSGDKAVMREEWIAFDTGEELKKDYECVIHKGDTGEYLEYVDYPGVYFYANSAFNVDKFYPNLYKFESLRKSKSINESIYTDNGYKNRADYLQSLADDFGVDINTVKDLASVLGADEDFDALVTELEDMVDDYIEEDDDDFDFKIQPEYLDDRFRFVVYLFDNNKYDVAINAIGCNDYNEAKEYAIDWLADTRYGKPYVEIHNNWGGNAQRYDSSNFNYKDMFGYQIDELPTRIQSMLSRGMYDSYYFRDDVVGEERAKENIDRFLLATCIYSYDL